MAPAKYPPKHGIYKIVSKICKPTGLPSCCESQIRAPLKTFLKTMQPLEHGLRLHYRRPKIAGKGPESKQVQPSPSKFLKGRTRQAI